MKRTALDILAVSRDHPVFMTIVGAIGIIGGLWLHMVVPWP